LFNLAAGKNTLDLHRMATFQRCSSCSGCLIEGEFYPIWAKSFHLRTVANALLTSKSDERDKSVENIHRWAHQTRPASRGGNIALNTRRGSRSSSALESAIVGSGPVYRLSALMGTQAERREKRAISLGAINHDSGAATTKLITTTAGISRPAWTAKAGVISTATMPIPNTTALTIRKMRAAIENRIDIADPLLVQPRSP
jgi:hypothetical protein